jgi:O-methyltransferase involved in polyketide biosynthesis
LEVAAATTDSADVGNAGYAVERAGGVTPALAGVSETMLWALHNRATEAKRRDGVLVDPESARIHELIDYDFARRFGEPAGSLAARAAAIDRTLRLWLERHPDGIVVSLGEGLETQRQRVDNGRMRWLTVDLPDAIRLRERFLTPTDRFRHFTGSALEPDWMDAVDAGSGIFVIAQGLLMYLEPEQVRHLFTRIADRFPGAEIVFDAVPRWFSHLTLLGLHQTPHYRLPAMPWGIDRDEIEPTLLRWHPGISRVAFLDYTIPRGLPRMLADMTSRVPGARHRLPSLAHVSIANAHCHTSAAAKEIYPERNVEESGFCLGQPTENRRPDMTSTDDHLAGSAGVRDMVAMASQNAIRGGDIARAATQVIAKRVALGVAGTADPLRADHIEFARMVPEKVEAFSAAGMVMLEQSGQVGRQIMRLASDEVMTTVHATMEMSGCSCPASFAELQGKLARAWFDRMTSSFIMMGTIVLTAQAAAMMPIQETVLANVDRLSG